MISESPFLRMTNPRRLPSGTSAIFSNLRRPTQNSSEGSMASTNRIGVIFITRSYCGKPEKDWKNRSPLERGKFARSIAAELAKLVDEVSLIVVTAIECRLRRVGTASLGQARNAAAEADDPAEMLGRQPYLF